MSHLNYRLPSEVSFFETYYINGYGTINVIFIIIIIIIINLFQFGLKINAQRKSTITNYHQQPENKKKNIKKT